MTATQPIIDAARRISSIRQKTYGLDSPRAVSVILARPPHQIGLWARLRLLWYIYLGGVFVYFRLLWRYLLDRDTPRRALIIHGLQDALQLRLSPDSRVLTGPFERRLYARNLARVPRIIEKMLFRTTPHLVAQVRTEDDIVQVFEFARERKLPVYPRGISSSAFGGTTPTHNGIVLDLSRMAKISAIDRTELTATIEPGVRWADLAQELAPHGLALCTTPTSRFSTVGGWASTGGIGVHSYRYGPFRETILAARIVQPNGHIAAMEKGDPSLDDYIGTEGQLGVFSQLTLRLRQPSPSVHPFLLTFNAPWHAFECIQELQRKGLEAVHIVYFDTERMKEENHLFRDRYWRDSTIVPEKESVLILFDAPEHATAFMEYAAGNGSIHLHEGPAAWYLWAERYFPLKAQRLGPNLLAAEVVLAPDRVPEFIREARRQMARFGIAPAFEANIAQNSGELQCIVIASFTADATRLVDYTLRLACVQLLTSLGVQCGGYPYGIGIWNTPYVEQRVDPVRIARLKLQKKTLDPTNILNPHKFFRVRSRFFNLPGLLLIAPIYRASLATLQFFSVVPGLIARLLRREGPLSWVVPPALENNGLALIKQTLQRCTFCGACVSVCPAYLLTNDELVTARSKLMMAELMLQGKTMSIEEVSSPFQCIRCGLCEEVCQTRLPLRLFYAVFEDFVARRYEHWPSEVISRFIQSVDERRDWIESTFGLDLADWSPPSMHKTLAGSRGESP